MYIEGAIVVLSKDGKYEYIEHDQVYLLKKDYYDNADDLEQKVHIMSV